MQQPHGKNDAGRVFPVAGVFTDKIPLAKTDVLQRLEISVQLAAADRARRSQQKKQQGRP
jgi:hypothetical protein